MELGLRRLYGRRSGAIVGSGVAFAKVICLNIGRDTTQELPVDLIEVIGKQDHTADDTNPRCRFNNKLDTSEEELELCPHGWSVVPLGEGEFSTLVAQSDIGIVCKLPLGGQSLGGSEVNGICIGWKTLIVGASHWNGQLCLHERPGRDAPLVGSHSVVSCALACQKMLPAAKTAPKSVEVCMVNYDWEANGSFGMMFYVEKGMCL